LARANNAKHLAAMVSWLKFPDSQGYCFGRQWVWTSGYALLQKTWFYVNPAKS